MTTPAQNRGSEPEQIDSKRQCSRKVTAHPPHVWQHGAVRHLCGGLVIGVPVGPCREEEMQAWLVRLLMTQGGTKRERRQRVAACWKYLPDWVTLGEKEMTW